MTKFFQEHFSETAGLIFLSVIIIVHYLFAAMILDTMNGQAHKIQRVEEIIAIVPEIQKDIADIKKIMEAR